MSALSGREFESPQLHFLNYELRMKNYEFGADALGLRIEFYD